MLLVSPPCVWTAAEGSSITFKFTTRTTTGAPTALANGALRCYKDNSTTEFATGLILTADYDSRTGLNEVFWDLSTTATYEPGYDYTLILHAGTVGGTSVAGEVLAHLRIEKDTPWDMVRANHALANTFGDVVTTADISGASWDATAADYNSAGTMGRLLNIIGRIFQ